MTYPVIPSELESLPCEAVTFFPTVIVSAVRRMPNGVEGPHVRWQRRWLREIFHGTVGDRL